MSGMNGTSKRLALVTGATRGIGRAIALALGASGNVVVGTATTEAVGLGHQHSLRAQVEGASVGVITGR